METRLFSLYYLKSWFSQASVLEAGAENFCWENNVKPLNFEAGRIGTENQFRFTEIQASLNSCCPSLNLVLHSSTNDSTFCLRRKNFAEFQKVSYGYVLSWENKEENKKAQFKLFRQQRQQKQQVW